MGFESMLAFLLTPLLGWIVALYFIKSKPRKRVLPSIAFWDMVIDRVKENALWQRYRGTIFLLLQLLAVAAAILALARPFSTGGISGDVIVVIDTSASMGATDVSPSRFERAREEALGLLGSFRGSVRVLVVDMGGRPKLVLPFTADLVKVRAAIAALECTHASSCSSAELLTFLGSVKTSATGHVFLFGDGFDGQAAKTVFPDGQITVHSFARSADNVAVTSFKVAGSAQRATITARAVNFSTRSFSGLVELQGAHLAVQSRPIDLPARTDTGPSERLLVFKDLRFLTLPELLRIRLKSAKGQRDALRADDSAWLAIRKEPVRVAIITRRTPKVIMRLLQSLPHLQPVVMDPPELQRRRAELDTMAVVISDDYLDAELLKRPLIVFHPLAATSFSTGRVVARPRPYVGDTTHPVMRYLGFPGLAIAGAVVLDGIQGGAIVLSCEHGPLIACLSSGKLRQVVCAFPLEQTNLSQKVGFPVFLTNALRWILGEDLQLAIGYRPGTLQQAPAGSGPLTVARSDPFPGSDVPASTKTLELSTGPLDVFHHVGVYDLTRGTTTLRCPVSVLNAAESDISPRGAAKVVINEGQREGREGSEGGYWRYFAFAFLVCAAVEWVLYCVKGG